MGTDLARACFRRLSSVKPGFESRLLPIPFSAAVLVPSPVGLSGLRQEGHPA